MGADVSLEPLPPDMLAAYWPAVAGWVRAAASETASWTSSDWYGRIADGHAQLWMIRMGFVPTGVIITEIYDTAAGKTCALPIVGGSHLNESLPVLDVIEDWAKEQGCTRMQGCGREGWVRALKGLGWRPVSVEIAKDLH